MPLREIVSRKTIWGSSGGCQINIQERKCFTETTQHHGRKNIETEMWNRCHKKQRSELVTAMTNCGTLISFTSRPTGRGARPSSDDSLKDIHGPIKGAVYDPFRGLWNGFERISALLRCPELELRSTVGICWILVVSKFLRYVASNWRNNPITRPRRSLDRRTTEADYARRSPSFEYGQIRVVPYSVLAALG